MSDDKRAPRARVEAGDRDDAVEADAHIIDDEADARKKASGASGGESFRDAGHENAFWGGVAGLAIALLVFWVGVFRALAVAVLVFIGVALGQVADGDPKIINLIRRFFTSNN